MVPESPLRPAAVFPPPHAAAAPRSRRHRPDPRVVERDEHPRRLERLTRPQRLLPGRVRDRLRLGSGTGVLVAKLHTVVGVAKHRRRVALGSARHLLPRLLEPLGRGASDQRDEDQRAALALVDQFLAVVHAAVAPVVHPRLALRTITEGWLVTGVLVRLVVGPHACSPSSSNPRTSPVARSIDSPRNASRTSSSRSIGSTCCPPRRDWARRKIRSISARSSGSRITSACRMCATGSVSPES